jgi:acid phosphatase
MSTRRPFRARPHSAAIGVSAALLLVLAGCTPAPPPPSSSATGTTAELQHVVIIMEENKAASAVRGNAAAPYLNGLADEYAVATDYHSVSHPSLPNYLAITGGTTAGITSDCNPPGGRCQALGPNIADEIVASGRSWKMYAESMPAPCTLFNSGDYAVKHNPFLYYPSVTRDAASCAAHDVPFSRFAQDLATTTTLPDYSFISPNLCNDMHSCSVATGDAWLAREVPLILSSPAFTQQNSLLIITFDEAEGGGNSVLCVFAGPAARRGYASPTPYTHYSILRTLELAWRLQSLTRNDATALPMTAMLAESP